MYSASPMAGYLETIPVFWDELYPDGGESLYCGDKFRPFDRRYNIEHVYPMSWVSRSLDCGDRRSCRRSNKRFAVIESDMHNMYPARKSVNKARGAMPFSMLKGEKHIERACDLEIDFRSRKVEPRPQVRGDIARAMLYMADTYSELSIFKKQRKMLERWHRDDPPSPQEKARDLQIKRIQGNSNPYIQ